MIPASQIRHFFDRHQPTLVDDPSLRRAEVALVLETGAGGDDPRILFIQRAEHADDPWSGQMAFPGGRRENTDTLDGGAAQRETYEEIGLALSPAQLIGRLDDLRGRHGGRSANLVISCFVFLIDNISALTPNYEVADIVQLPISRLLDPKLQTKVRYEAAEGLDFPGIFLGHQDERVIWGLTYRFLRNFFSLFDHHLPSS